MAQAPQGIDAGKNKADELTVVRAVFLVVAALTTLCEPHGGCLRINIQEIVCFDD